MDPLVMGHRGHRRAVRLPSFTSRARLPPVAMHSAARPPGRQAKCSLSATVASPKRFTRCLASYFFAAATSAANAAAFRLACRRSFLFIMCIGRSAFICSHLAAAPEGSFEEQAMMLRNRFMMTSSGTSAPTLLSSARTSLGISSSLFKYSESPASTEIGAFKWLEVGWPLCPSTRGTCVRETTCVSFTTSLPSGSPSRHASTDDDHTSDRHARGANRKSR